MSQLQCLGSFTEPHLEETSVAGNIMEMRLGIEMVSDDLSYCRVVVASALKDPRPTAVDYSSAAQITTARLRTITLLRPPNGDWELDFMHLVRGNVKDLDPDGGIRLPLEVDEAVLDVTRGNHPITEILRSQFSLELLCDDIRGSLCCPTNSADSTANGRSGGRSASPCGPRPDSGSSGRPGQCPNREARGCRGPYRRLSHSLGRLVEGVGSGKLSGRANSEYLRCVDLEFMRPAVLDDEMERHDLSRAKISSEDSNRMLLCINRIYRQL